MTAKPAKSEPQPTRNGLSLHIGLNSVDPRHYGGFDTAMAACEQDAAALAALAQRAGFTATSIVGNKATRANVLKAVRKITSQLAGGDLFFCSFSGCGSQVPDYEGGERDTTDPTWCLYDCQLFADEIIAMCAIDASPRVLFVVDCSYSGTVTRASAPLYAGPGNARIRMLPPAVAIRTYTQNRLFYDTLQRDRARLKPLPPKGAANRPAFIVLQGSQDNQTALEDDSHGSFTSHLLVVWKNGAFKGNYRSFLAAVKAAMPPTQTPLLTTIGDATRFLEERPFTI
jgi:hypothetical protein